MNLKDKLYDAIEDMPKFVWYIGWFIVGYVVGSW